MVVPHLAWNPSPKRSNASLDTLFEACCSLPSEITLIWLTWQIETPLSQDSDLVLAVHIS